MRGEPFKHKEYFPSGEMPIFDLQNPNHLKGKINMLKQKNQSFYGLSNNSK